MTKAKTAETPETPIAPQTPEAPETSTMPTTPEAAHAVPASSDQNFGMLSYDDLARELVDAKNTITRLQEQIAALSAKASKLDELGREAVANFEEYGHVDAINHETIDLLRAERDLLRVALIKLYAKIGRVIGQLEAASGKVFGKGKAIDAAIAALKSQMPTAQGAINATAGTPRTSSFQPSQVKPEKSEEEA